MNVEPIEQFIKKFRAASAGRSKDVRLTIEEASALSAALGELLAAHVKLIQATADVESPVEEPVIKIDGGGFR